ncbi:MAG: VCBS domain-containing protein, partial [Halothiobacillaceae bacterium]|nr:VCBS domain-containing protein [Halothiobacillaceae bacterium]
TILGGAGDDKLYGEAGANYLEGGDGNDLLNTGAGSILIGGAGDDDLSAGGGNNTLDGGAGNNTLFADGGGNTLYAGAGNDELAAHGGGNTLDGGDGTNLLVTNGLGGNTLIAGSGDDTLSSEGGNNYLDGGEGNNILVATEGGNTLIAGSGDDTLSAYGGNNTLDGGEGTNLLVTNGLGGNTLIAGSGDDTLSSEGGNNTLDGGAGRDILITTGDNNTLIGGAGDDWLSAVQGGGNTLIGGDGRDTYAFDKGFGVSHIVDTPQNVNAAVAVPGDYARFNFPFYGSGIVIGLGSLKLSFANGDELHIDGFDPENPENTCPIGSFQFNDITLTLQDILDLGGPAVNFTIGPDISGTEGADIIQGTDKAEHIYGLGGDDTLLGGGRADVLYGGDGNDTLDGGAGLDKMYGGAGDDTYVLTEAGDQVSEDQNGGHDTVLSAVDHGLGGGFEDLVLTGSANIYGIGNGLDNHITGNDGDNNLLGDRGDDTLDGGAGADTMTGGYGDDTYVVDNAGDLVNEAAVGETFGNWSWNPYTVQDIDTVKSSISYTLGNNLENLNLLGADSIDGTGNELNNILNGNSGDNTLRGMAGNDVIDGGAGADVLEGGVGSDIYYVDNINDQVIEDMVGRVYSYFQWVWTANGYQYLPYSYTQPDFEYVYSSVEFTLGTNLENLVLTGNNPINGTGNELNNEITGNDSDNVLIGGAGSDTLSGMGGIDTLVGGAGDDFYNVADSGDVIIEQPGEGYDKVYAEMSYTLSANIEELQLGGDAVSGTGNDSDNIIGGNAQDNILDGAAGNDSLDGHSGDDVISGGDGNDTIYGGWDDHVSDENGNWSPAPNNDYLDGGAGDDNIDGGSGADTIIGGTGNDVLFGGYDDYGEGGVDPLINNDTIDGGEGDDQIDGGSGEDILLGGAGNDYLYGGDESWANTYYDYVTHDFVEASSNDFLDGGSGDDRLEGGSGDDVLVGGAGADALYGGDGNDVMYGTRREDITSVSAMAPESPPGLDYIEGGTGDDTYIVGGTYIKVDDWVVNECGDSIPVQALQWTTDTVIEYYTEGYDIVYSSASYILPNYIEELRLTFDASLEQSNPLAYADLLSVGQDGFGNDWGNIIIGNQLNNRLDGDSGADYLEGGAGDDTYVVDQAGDVIVEEADAGVDTVESAIDYSLNGTNLENLTLLDGAVTGEGNEADNVIQGSAGYNELYGGAGNDTLIGNGGDDALYGGAGDDRYVYRPGDGEVWIYDSEGLDTLFIGGDLTASDIETTRSGNNLVLSVIGTWDQVVINDWFIQDAGVNRIEFCDGSSVENMINRAPVATAIADQVTEQDAVFGFTVPVEAFVDHEDGMALSYSASLAGGVPLPSWLTFDASTRTFGGIPDNWDVGTMAVRVTATDSGGKSTSSNFVLDVLNVNDAPNALAPLDDMSVEAAQAFSYSLPSNAPLQSFMIDQTDTGTAEWISSYYDYDNYLWGGVGNDTFTFARGDGNVYIGEWGNSPMDIVQLMDVIPADISMSSDQWGRVKISMIGGADSITLGNWLDYPPARIEQILFADGTVWGAGEIMDMISLVPTAGNDYINGTSGDDSIQALGGDDAVFGGDGNDALSGGDGNDRLDAGAGDDFLSGGAGDDDLYGGGGNDVLNGGDGADGLFGAEGDDKLDGGAGNDYLDGGYGNDTYLFGRESGQDSISEWDDTAGNVDRVEFGAEVTSADVSVYESWWGNVVLSINGTTDSLTMENWLDSDESKVEQFVFADGTVWGQDDIMARLTAAPVTPATTGDDEILGTVGNDWVVALSGDDDVRAGEGNDTVLAGAGNDSIDGGGGSNILSGGSGSDEVVGDDDYIDTNNDFLDGGLGDDYVVGGISNDLLIGGAGNDEVSGDDGNDVFLFNRGDGSDWYYSNWSENEVLLSQRTDTVSLGGGISYEDLSFMRDGYNLVLNTGNGESITFEGWFDNAWSDNKAISTLQIVSEAMPGYDTNSIDPLLNKRIQQFDFLALANQFEADYADDLVIDAWQLAPHLADAHLGGSDTSAIGGDMAYLYGKNGNLDGLSEAELRAQLTNASFGTASQTLTKTGNLSGSAVFSDVDFIHGDSLSYSATLADGSPLPTWLTFDSLTQTFSGTPGDADGGELNVSVIATDTGGLSAATSFVLTVTGGQVNVAPVAIADSVTTHEDAGQATIAVADLLVNDTDNDAVDTLSLNGFDAVTANGNTVSQDANGDLILSLVNDYQSLGEGQTAIDSFSYSIADAAGATSTATVNVTITGTNDAPIMATAIANQSTLQDAPFSFTVPADSFTDIDNGDLLTYTATMMDGSALPAWLTFDAATQTFSGVADNRDVGLLAVRVTATDLSGASASGTFMLDVQNVNDTPTANADVGAAVEDGGSVLLEAATLLANDTDPDFIHGDTLSITGVSQANSGAAVSLVNGAVQYDIGNLYQSLAQGQTATDTFSYTVTDSAGATSTAEVSMTITGVNDGPVAADDLAVAQEDLGITASGNVLANDFDVDEGTVLQVANAGTQQGQYGSLVLNADGSYNYVLDNNALAVQSLAQGQTVSEQFTYFATDGIASTPATLTVTITGSNDAPVTEVDTATVQEDVVVAASGNVLSNDTDVDQGTVISVANVGVFVGQFGTLNLNADGSYEYVLDNTSPGVQSLAQGQVVSDVFAYQATDGMISTPSALTVSISGSNDAPIVMADAAGVQEDFSITASGNVLSNDSDIDRATVLQVANAGVFVGQYGTLTLSIDGSYEYVLDNASMGVQSLAEGQVVTDSFDYAATDGIASTPSTLTVSITGTNDAPVTTVDTAAVQEDVTLSATGNVLANDVDIDQGTVLQVANSGVFIGQYGTLTLNADGSYEYVLDNASLGVQSLAQGQIVTDAFDYAATDGIASTPSTLTVSITGTNDAPVVMADTAAVQEDLNVVTSGNVLANDTDIDQGTVLQVANAGSYVGQFGTLVLNVDGSYSYVLDNSSDSVQSLAEGQVVTDTFAYQATDGITSTPSTLTVSITGTNDAPVVVADIAAVQEDLAIAASGNVLSNDSDIDQGTVLQVANAGVFVG